MKLYKNCKRLNLFLLAISLLINVVAFSPAALALENYDFTNFSEADAMAFIEAHDIDIPTKLLQSNKVGSFTLSTILQSYYNPNIEFCYNYDETQRYAENIRDAVILYTNSTAVPSVADTNTYKLQYNKVMDEDGNWVTSRGYYDTKWLNYNCYAYSITRAEQPSFYGTVAQYQPGDMSGAGSFSSCDTIEDLAEIVQADLEAMGYSNILLSETIPTINSSQQLICVRMSYADYHFMHYDIDTNAWYHKPGSTAILKYNIVPSNDNLWYRESSFYGTETLSSQPYDSDIIFIRYSKNQINIITDVTSREYIQPTNDIFCELNFANAGTYKIDLDSQYSIKYEIYDEDFEVIEYGTGTSNDNSINIEAGTYYLRMNFESYTGSYYVDITIHAHLYTDRYVWQTEILHKSYCGCGEYSIEQHVIKQGSISNGGYGICLQCRGRVFMGVLQSVPHGLAHTDNGSYILTNGIIVLVDEDIDAYMTGKLEFYYGAKE